MRIRIQLPIISLVITIIVVIIHTSTTITFFVLHCKSSFPFLPLLLLLLFFFSASPPLTSLALCSSVSAGCRINTRTASERFKAGHSDEILTAVLRLGWLSSACSAFRKSRFCALQTVVGPNSLFCPPARHR